MALVLWSLLILTALGTLFGLGLAYASRFFSVEGDPRIERVAAALPGINCGACGYPGCEGYATAVVKQGAATGLCVPGGPKAAAALAEIMGVKLEGDVEEVRAVVHCQGGCDRSRSRFEYRGPGDCRAASLIQGGPKACEYGCLGLGTCVSSCPFGAITLGPDGIPVVDWDRCTGCGTCVRACPRGLIETLPKTITHFLACSSQDKGKPVKDVCSVGCVACWLCVKVSSDGSIEKKGNLPRLLYPRGADYAAALDKCPQHCFVKVERSSVPQRARRTAP